MRRALVVLALLAAACGDDVCTGVDGACVALTVRGVGEIDGLDVTLDGAARDHTVVPRTSATASLPVHVALRLPTAGTFEVTVVGVRLGTIVGAARTSVAVGAGTHTSASVVLGTAQVDGGLGGGFDLACPANATRCAGACCGPSEICDDGQCVPCSGGGVACVDVCCKSGEVCRGNGCVPPYATAKLQVYLCPNFGTGCSTGALRVGTQCSAVTAPQPGKCYVTDAVLEPGKTYDLAACASCPGNCGNSTSFSTPALGFSAPNYYSHIAFFCGASCDAPASCP